MDADNPMLIVSDLTNNALVFIKITNDGTMVHSHTQQLNYIPHGSYNDKGDLMVCDYYNHKIYRYRPDGETLAVIKLPVNVWPWRVTRHGDQYVVSDWDNAQVVMIDGRGQVMTRYKDDIHGMELGRPRNVITDPHRGVLIADNRHNQVMLLRKTGDVVKILDQHVIQPWSLYLDTDHHRLYVSGKDQQNVHHLFKFNYTLLTGGKELTMNITKLEMNVEMWSFPLIFHEEKKVKPSLSSIFNL